MNSALVSVVLIRGREGIASAVSLLSLACEIVTASSLIFSWLMYFSYRVLRFVVALPFSSCYHRLLLALVSSPTIFRSSMQCAHHQGTVGAMALVCVELLRALCASTHIRPVSSHSHTYTHTHTHTFTHLHTHPHTHRNTHPKRSEPYKQWGIKSNASLLF